MTDEQLSALFGPLYPYADHKRGDVIRFRDEGVTKEGTILWICGPGPAVEGSPDLGVVYVVDAGDGWPAIVYPGDILVEGR